MGRRSPAPPDEVIIQEGSYALYEGRDAKVRKILDAELVLIEYLDTCETAKVFPWEIKSHGSHIPKEDHDGAIVDLADITNEEFASAKKVFDIINPLLRMKNRTRSDVEKAAQKHGVNVSTIYAWIKTYCETGHISALVKRKTGPKQGSTRLSPEVDAIITKCINENHLTQNQPPPMHFFEAVEDQCKLAGLKPPHRNTLRNRLADIPPEISLARRGNQDKADRLSKPMPGEFPQTTYPLECVQIDHCVLDIQIVYEETREPIAVRPWLTLAIDAFSRMIVGYFLSLLRPSSFSAGAALYMGIMPKKNLLQTLNIPGTWPIYGKMESIHADNAREFKGKTLKLACDEHKIISVLRPVKDPKYGAYIERAIGNISREMQKKKGATQSRPWKNDDYDAVNSAVYTLSELEHELVDWIVNCYHTRKHSALNTTPLQRYKIGIMGDGKIPGCGLPPIPQDTEKLRLDFLPYERRTIQNYGVELGLIFYYDRPLDKWINAPDPENPKEKRKFIFRYDPRSIKFIWFYDPELKRYFKITSRNTLRPDISWSEFNEYKNKIKKEGNLHADEESIFDYRQRSIAREAIATEKTRLARKDKNKKQNALRSPHATAPGSALLSKPVSQEKIRMAETPSTENDPFSDDIAPFDDFEA
ncbi:MAG TPA: Mu transposase C-terminal domain-containing protein [Pseudomonadales bacterium]|nr:Mu transposase C-terminal domain-containing protein [Pseudomonadales bacterium]